MSKKRLSINNRYCARCHGTYNKSEFTGESTICKICLLLRPKHKVNKINRKPIEPDEITYMDIWGSGGAFN